MNDGPEFYVGYQESAPPGLARAMRSAAAALLLLAVALAAVLALAQGAFEPSRFEFQQYREYQGLFSAWPYPTLSTNGVEYLLVGEGKFGAARLPRDADGRMVRLQGAKVENGVNRMLELLPDSFRALAMPAPQRATQRHGPVTLAGEIVDTKCHFGVMNPGKGKVHRDCAVRCISGGVPPGLLVRDASGAARVFILAAKGGAANSLGKQLLDYVAEPVVVTGELIRAGSLWVLEIDPSAVKRE